MSDFKGITYYRGIPENLHPILQKHRKILKQFADERVFAIETDGYDFVLSEQCDGYFGTVLSKEKCLELSELFREIADEIEK